VLKNLATRHFEERSDEKSLFFAGFPEEGFSAPKTRGGPAVLASLEMRVPLGIFQHPALGRAEVCLRQAGSPLHCHYAQITLQRSFGKNPVNAWAIGFKS
jgi:hypothetical protein